MVYSSQFGSRRQKIAEFTASGNWTRPAGVDTVEVFLVGGGGGAGGKDSSIYGATGSGGGGAVIRKLVDVTSVPVGSSIAVTIGAGGAGGTTAGTAGGAGGSSSFGALLTALGGGGGSGIAADAAVNSGVTSGIASQGGGARMVGGAGCVCGLGGGAGGPAISAYSTDDATGYPRPRTTVGQNIVQGLEPVVISTSQCYSPAYSAPGIDNYGAGGGFSEATYAVITAKTAGKQGSINGVANSGSGGAGRYFGATTAAGGSGGSGFATITWWE